MISSFDSLSLAEISFTAARIDPDVIVVFFFFLFFSHESSSQVPRDSAWIFYPRADVLDGGAVAAWLPN